jgi:F-type H+-transporting ATPase subunit a
LPLSFFIFLRFKIEVKQKMKKSFLIVLTIIFAFSFNAMAENNSKKFNAGDVIMEHLGDEHSWKILTYKTHEVAIPLPVILINNGKISCFMSYKFNNPTQSYKGFKIGSEQDGKDLGGKIICVDKNNKYTGQKPWDFSITKNVFGIFIIAAIMIIMVVQAGKISKRRKGKAPKGLQNLIEIFVDFIANDIAIPSIGKEKYHKYLNYLLSVFMFIFLCNVMGLVPFFPGGANITGNIAVTLTLALFTLIITNVSGTKTYWSHIVNMPGVPLWLKMPVPLMPALEVVEIFTKPFSLTVRLFANITAGHVIMLSFVCIIFIFGEMSPALGYGVSIVPLFFSVFMFFIELLVAFIQAYVFTLLSSIYIGLALEKAHE